MSYVKEGHALSDTDLVITIMETPVKDPVQKQGKLVSHRNRREVEDSKQSLRRCRGCWGQRDAVGGHS